ncbi:endolytic transglycosylase MltG [Microbacterium trichothecenolyticum]|uniref:Endolytic murein transglycosylase n=1 Tax=Microbacterium trichothecenolyticum TaxID=69370 RepID=A0ABU0TRH0_MICTR|nr:endolytic transglycosylase MltG [Microbacterium trichothecenolyticum]MDQ1122258.1 UPF0755 protein [Microbacterium trichothecenolyticum]
MPENDSPPNDSPENDRFADLFGRLPDPRTGARAASPDAAGAAPSRRAAREARRGTTGPTPTSASGSAPATGKTAAGAGEDARAPHGVGDPGATPAPSRSRETTSVPAPRAAAAATPDATAPATAPNPPTRRPDAARRAQEPGPRRTAAPAGPGISASTAAPAGRADAARRAEEPHIDEPARERTAALVGAAVAAAPTTPAHGATGSGSLEDLFTGETTTHEIGSPPPRPAKKRRRVGGWIALGVVVLILGGIVGGGVALWNTYGERVQAFFGASEPTDFEAGQATGEARITIVAGDTGESVSPKLFEAGVTKASNSLYTFMVDNGVVFTFQPGVYKLQQQMTSEAVLTALRNPANRLNYSVQLREGLTLNQSLELISEQIGIPRADLDAAVADPSQYGVPASSLEGWIFPATYDFDEGVTARQVIQRMVQRTIQSLDTAGVPVDDRERILIIASIIEREARSSDDFYKVSRVIENRLQPSNQETFGKLEMDSTVQYGAGEMGSGSVSTSTEARNDDNPWNTYIHPGLPVGPIANPGDLAIDAAMKPVDGPWLYFVTVNLDTGETVFTSTYSEHEKAVAQWRAWCADNPDSGC